MNMIRRAIIAAALLAGLSPSFAQVPPPVPALPDTTRQTNYSITASTCACAVNFALYGDSTDYENWLQVWLNGVQVAYNDSTYGWTITSPTGPLSTIPRPVTDAVLTFDSAQTGAVQIVGARRPRRTSQFSENRGVAARDLNQLNTDIIAQNREEWDFRSRVVQGIPGDNLTPLPGATARAGGYMGFDTLGNPIVLPGTGSSPTGIPNNTAYGNISGTTAPASPLTATQLTTLCNTFTTSLKGCAPASGGGTSNFLRADGSWASPTAAAPGCVNALAAGFVGDGVTANDAAFNSAWSSLGTTGGCIYFPAGKYVFASAISKTLPAAKFSIGLKGDGPVASILHWPNAGGGMTLTQSVEENTFHLRDLSLTTAQVDSGNAFHAVGLGADNGSYWQSDIINVQISGDDIGLTIPTSHCWHSAIFLHAWPSVYIANTNTWGPHQSPGGSGCGTGLIFEGDTATAQYAVLLNVVASSFNNHTNGWLLGSYWQGITCVSCNFNGQLGNSCITANGASGIQVLLEIIGSQFDCPGGIILSSAVDNVTISGNSIGVLTNNGWAANAAAGQTFIFTNNIIAPGGSLTGTFGLVYGGSTAIVGGNVFRNVATGVNLQASSSAVNVSQNIYPGVTTQVVNSGTGNSVGAATK